MREGLYGVFFQTPLGSGAGVVTLLGGRLRGGDLALYYVGDYNVSGDQFTAKLRTGRHHNDRGVQSVFGRDEVEINLTGKISGNQLQATGSSPQAPGISFRAALNWIAD